MKCLLLSRYGRLGASSRLRSLQYLPFLKANGVDVSVSALFPDRYIQDLYAGRGGSWWLILRAYIDRIRSLLKSRRGFDLLWIESELLPWLPARAEALLARGKIPYLVDYDDAIFHRYDLHPNQLVRGLLARKIDMVMRHAALVIVGNDYLAEHARSVGATRVEIVPTVVDLSRYGLARAIDKTTFTVGWIGSPTTARYLDILRPALSRMAAFSEMRVVLVGANGTRFSDVKSEVRTWSEETEVQSIQDFDVGVMPLPDEPWTRGKCGYKLLQYMACSRPVVASPVGVNRKIVEEQVNGYLAATTEDWVAALTILKDDPVRAVTMGQAGRKKVESQYSLEVVAPRLLSLLTSVDA